MYALKETLIDPEHALLLAARAGDREALERFCRGRYRWMRRLAILELGDASRADDAVQEALIAVLRKLDQWDPDRPFVPWLATIVRNAARMQRRRWRPWEAWRPRASGVSLERELDLRRAGNRVVRALAELTPAERQAVYHVDVLELPVSEVAALLEKNPSTLRVLLHRGRGRLRALLGEHLTLLEDR